MSNTPAAALLRGKRRRTGDATLSNPQPNIQTPSSNPLTTSAQRISPLHIKEEKVQAISQLLRDWRWSFVDLMKAWLEQNAGRQQKSHIRCSCLVARSSQHKLSAGHTFTDGPLALDSLCCPWLVHLT